MKKVFLNISQNSQENTCARVSFLIKLQARPCNFSKKETLAQVFSCEFCEISKNTFFYRTPLVAASGRSEDMKILSININYFHRFFVVFFYIYLLQIISKKKSSSLQINQVLSQLDFISTTHEIGKCFDCNAQPDMGGVLLDIPKAFDGFSVTDSRYLHKNIDSFPIKSVKNDNTFNQRKNNAGKVPHKGP